MKSRRTFLKESALAAGLGLPIGGKMQMSKESDDDGIIGHGNYRYRVHKDWAKISLAHNPILNCHEMVMDSQGRLIMIGDHTDNNIFIFDKSGKLLDTWGNRYPGGHGLTLSKEGEEDFLFLVDCGWYQDKYGVWNKQAGVVSKTTLNGQLIFNLPDPRLVGIYEQSQPFMPTETTVAPNGDIYVADGYGSDYILQYSHTGKFIRRFGGKDNVDANYNLNNAHGVAVDLRENDNPMLIVTSRADNCFKKFTLEGTYLDTIPLPGLYVCRPVIDDLNIYAGVCWSKQKSDNQRTSDSGFVTILEGDRVVSNPGGTEPIYVDGKVQQMYQSGQIFNHGHDVCVDEDRNLYVCQWNAHQTPPIKLERV